MGILDRIQHGWNAFMNKDPPLSSYNFNESSYSYRPDRLRLTRGNEKSIVTAVFNRISLDVASVKIEHVRLDENDRYLSTIKSSGLNNCLTLEANLDQTSKAFIQDVVLSMFDEGCVALVPFETTSDPIFSDSYDVLKLRTGKIIQWYPDKVKINIYNEKTGKKEDVILPKKMVAIVENPFYSIMNENNSTLKRLIRKMNILDVIDDENGSGKLNLIIQLPYSVKGEIKKNQAEKRRESLENQLVNSKYGIAYMDATEHITQLNRSIDNNLLTQVEYLTSMLYSQLGITTSIMDGTADDKTMNNYFSRIIEVVLEAIVLEMKRKFISKTARSQGQSICFFRDPFKLIPTNTLAEIADKFTRNEIMTSNEIRQGIGMKPSTDPKADELRNKNINQSNEEITPVDLEEEIQNA